MNLGWDPTVQIVIAAYPLDELDEDDDETDPMTADLTLTGCLTEASSANFLESIGDAAVIYNR